MAQRILISTVMKLTFHPAVADEIFQANNGRHKISHDASIHQTNPMLFNFLYFISVMVFFSPFFQALY